MDVHLFFGNLVHQSITGQSHGPISRDHVIKSMIFEANDIVSFSASNVDFETAYRGMI